MMGPENLPRPAELERRLGFPLPVGIERIFQAAARGIRPTLLTDETLDVATFIADLVERLDRTSRCVRCDEIQEDGMVCQTCRCS